jgi:hypothetical protein
MSKIAINNEENPMTDLKVKGDLGGVDVEKFLEIRASYEGTNPFIKDVLFNVEKWKTASAKQMAAVIKCFKQDEDWAKKNKARLERVVPMVDGKGEVIGEVVSIKQYESRWSAYTYKMLIEDFKGYRVFGTVPAFFLEADVKVGDFVKFNAKLRQKELGFGFFSYPKKGVFVDSDSATITKEEIESKRPKITEESKEVKKKAEVTRELMDFLSA